MKKTLVTGGAGFVGSHLCEALLGKGHHVVCVDNFSTGSWNNITSLQHDSNFEVVEHDVLEPLHLEVSRIFHLACPASPVHYQSDPIRTLRTAVEGTRNMLSLAHDQSARILIASTSEVYGEPGVHPQPEAYWGYVNPIGKRSCYDEGKRCAEALVAAYVESLGTAARVVRIFNTYGPRMDEADGRVVSNFITQALAGEPLTLYGEGEQTRSFCFVSDLVDGLMRMMEHPNDPGPVNLGNPDERTVRELAELVLEKTRSRSKLEFHPLPSDDPTRRCPDISKATQLLGWKPTVPLASGVERTIAYFRKRRMPSETQPGAGTRGRLAHEDKPSAQLHERTVA